MSYDSHRPALRAIAKFMDIRRVVEFGAGEGSTPFFLDRTVFPLLESLVTFEHDEKWAGRMSQDDRRHKMIHCSYTDFALLSAAALVDLVFVDSGPNFTARRDLFPHAAKLAPVTVLHDCGAAEFKDIPGEHHNSKSFLDGVQTLFVSDTVDLSGLEI